jgi:CubicO group peptidase (beta-lactamase class C family)
MSPTNLWANIEVGTGMGAKLACSGKFVTGQSPATIAEDLASYSPVLRLLNIEYDNSSTTASLAGLAITTATFRPGLGCTLNRGATDHLDALIVPELEASTAQWPAGSMVSTLDESLTRSLNNLLVADNAAGYVTRALVVVRDGQLVAEAYADGYSPQTPLMGWSMGKSLVAIMLGNLALNKQIDGDENNLFEAWKGDNRRTIKLEQLLQMTSGLDFDETYAPGSDATHMLFTAPGAAAVAMASELADPPGTHFAYSSGTTNLLTHLYTRRNGGTLGALNHLYEQIFRPLGMAHSILELDPSGDFIGSSYIYASARDWARLGQLMLNDGILNNERIVSADWVRRSQQPNTSSNDPRYGYQLWLNGTAPDLRWPELPADAYAMQGNRAQTVMIVPSARAVVVRLGWSSGTYPMAENFASLLAFP